MTIRPAEPAYAPAAQHFRGPAPPEGQSLFDELLRQPLSQAPPFASAPAPRGPAVAPPEPAERERPPAAYEPPRRDTPPPRTSAAEDDASQPAPPPTATAAPGAHPVDDRDASSVPPPATLAETNNSAAAAAPQPADEASPELAAQVAEAAAIRTVVPNGPLSEPVPVPTDEGVETSNQAALGAAPAEAEAVARTEPAQPKPRIPRTAARSQASAATDGAAVPFATSAAAAGAAAAAPAAAIALEPPANPRAGPLAATSGDAPPNAPASNGAPQASAAVAPETTAPAAVPPVGLPKEPAPQGDAPPRALRKAAFAPSDTRPTATPSSAAALAPAATAPRPELGTNPESAPAVRPPRRRERGALEPIAEAYAAPASLGEPGGAAPAVHRDVQPPAAEAAANQAQLTLAPAPQPSASPASPAAPVQTISASGAAPQRPIPRSASHLFSGKGRGESRGPDVDQVRLLQRVARAFESARERGGEVRIRLSPPELGAIKVELQVQDGRLFARIEAETPAARAVLLDNLPVLRERLSEQGVRLERFDVDLSHRESSGQGGEQYSARDEQRREAAPPPVPRPRPPPAAAVDAATGSVQPGDERRVNVIV